MSPTSKVTFRQLSQAPPARLSHAFADVQADDAAGPGSEQFGQHAVTGGDVQYVAGFEQVHQAAGGRLPGPAGRIVPLHVAGHAVRPGPGAGAIAQHLGDALQVLLDQRVVAVAAQQLPQVVQARISDRPMRSDSKRIRRRAGP